LEAAQVYETYEQTYRTQQDGPKDLH